MANICNNIVVFTGEPAALENVKLLFKEIQDTQEATGKWHLPPYVTADFSHMQDITINDQKITYETRWYPNLQGLIQIADHHQLDFVNQYDELANGIFGEAHYVKGKFHDFRLETADLENVDAHDVAALEKALDRKIRNEVYFKSTGTITKAELNELYGDLLEGNLLIKFATHKNFDKAREIFDTWDERTIIEMENFLIGNFQHITELNFTIDEYIAMRFLSGLINEWQTSQQQNSRPNELGR